MARKLGIIFCDAEGCSPPEHSHTHICTKNRHFGTIWRTTGNSQSAYYTTTTTTKNTSHDSICIWIGARGGIAPFGIYVCWGDEKQKANTWTELHFVIIIFHIASSYVWWLYVFFLSFLRCTMYVYVPCHTGSGFSICIQPKLIDGEGVERHRLRPPPYQSYGFRILTHSLTHWLHCVRRLATARVFPNTQGQIECNINEKWKRDEIEIRSIFISSYGLFHSHHTHVDVPTPPLCRWRCCVQPWS